MMSFPGYNVYVGSIYFNENGDVEAVCVTAPNLHRGTSWYLFADGTWNELSPGNDQVRRYRCHYGKPLSAADLAAVRRVTWPARVTGTRDLSLVNFLSDAMRPKDVP